MPASLITYTKLNCLFLIHLSYYLFPTRSKLLEIGIQLIQQGLINVVLQQSWILKKSKENTPKLTSFQHELSKVLLFTLKTLVYSCLLCPKKRPESYLNKIQKSKFLNNIFFPQHVQTNLNAFQISKGISCE